MDAAGNSCMFTHESRGPGAPGDENMSETIHIIGHRNPDADAICSAIGYAALKQRHGDADYIPARCGNSNARIDAILSRFGHALPTFIGDVTPRVRDIMVRDIIKVPPGSICTRALEMIDEHDVRMLPVVDEDGRLYGSVSIFDLGEHFIPRPRDERKMRHVYTTIENIVEALGARVIHTFAAEELRDFFVRIGAMDIRSFGRYYQDDEKLARNSIIIVGDRYDIQQRSIQSGVSMLVISGDLPVEEDVIQRAREEGVSIIVSPHDSATTSWIIRSAGCIDSLMRRETLNFRPDDKLSIVRRKLAGSDVAACMVVGDDERLMGVFTKSDLLKPVRTNLILVDHNELSQAVLGADQVNILEIVDHHRLGNPPTQQPIRFINLPVGSTSSIVADLFRKENLEPEARTAGVLMGGIISDTLNLRGPTTTALDAEVLRWLEQLSGTRAEDLAGEIFSAGSIIKSASPEEVLRSDMKTYHEHGQRFTVSQVEELGFNNFWDRCDELQDALHELRRQENLLFAALMVTDINSQNSLLLLSGEEDILDRVTYPRHAANDLFELKGTVSRKKQLLPYLVNLVHSFVPAG